MSGILRFARLFANFRASATPRASILFGECTVNRDAVTRGLAAAGYDGWIVAEAFGRGVELLSSAACVHRDCFESRDEVAELGLSFMKSVLTPYHH